MRRGLIFKCSNYSLQECLDLQLFGADRISKDEVLAIEPNDALFLLNLDTDELMGVFTSASDGASNIVPGAWRGQYPYQVRFKAQTEIKTLSSATAVLRTFKVQPHRILYDCEATALTNLLSSCSALGSTIADTRFYEPIIEKLTKELTKTRKELNLDDHSDWPTLESTTLWDFPKQSYGTTPKGDNKYAGVTPAFIIWNLIKRYTNPGELVVDPMCGSGTTIDVCNEERRRVIGYDIVPVRRDIIQNDARSIPLPDTSVDMVFIDSPYGDNIKYNLSERSIGALSAESEEFYDVLELVMQESFRILKPGKVLAWLIGDQWVKHKFTPVGFKIYDRLTKYFEPLDIISITRRNQSSNTGMWHNRARKFNFYLRGFKYLHIVRKPLEISTADTGRDSVRWSYYDRGKSQSNTGQRRANNLIGDGPA